MAQKSVFTLWIIEHNSRSDNVSLLILSNDTDNGTASLIILFIKCSVSSVTVFVSLGNGFLYKTHSW